MDSVVFTPIFVAYIISQTICSTKKHICPKCLRYGLGWMSSGAVADLRDSLGWMSSGAVAEEEDLIRQTRVQHIIHNTVLAQWSWTHQKRHILEDKEHSAWAVDQELLYIHILIDICISTLSAPFCFIMLSLGDFGFLWIHLHYSILIWKNPESYLRLYISRSEPMITDKRGYNPSKTNDITPTSFRNSHADLPGGGRGGVRLARLFPKIGVMKCG